MQTQRLRRRKYWKKRYATTDRVHLRSQLARKDWDSVRHAHNHRSRIVWDVD